MAISVTYTLTEAQYLLFVDAYGVMTGLRDIKALTPGLQAKVDEAVSKIDAVYDEIKPTVVFEG